MKRISGIANHKRIVKYLIMALLMIAVCICFAGCRDRITNRDDADRVAKDENGIKNEQYEQRREDLGLELTAEKSISKKDKKEEQYEKRENEPSDSTKNSNTGSENKSTDVGNGYGTNGSGDNGKGNGHGNGRRGSKSSNKTDPGNKNENRNEEPQNKVIVHFDANGGSCEPNKKEYSKGSAYGELPVPSRDEFVFKGWYSSKEGGKQVGSKTKLIQDSEHTLYAKWQKEDAKTFTVSFNGNGGRVVKKDRSRKIQTGDRYGSLPTPIRDGYVFCGWFTDPEGGKQISEGDVFNKKNDCTLYAHWEYEPYTYWSFQLYNTREKMYSCQIIDCYIEFDDNKTASSCSLLSDAKIGNCARNREGNTTVTDEWIKGKNPSAIIKCKGGASDANRLLASVKERFPDSRIIVIPSSAVNGSKKEKLYFTLCLGKAIYPDWFEDIDTDKAGKELGVSGKITE